MLFDIFAGTFFAVLAGMGIGGGGLLVLYLTAVDEMPQLTAQGCNLLFFVYASAASLFVHNRRRRLNFRLIGISAVLALVGAQLGIWLAGYLPEETVRRLFGWMLILAGGASGIKLIFGKKK